MVPQGGSPREPGTRAVGWPYNVTRQGMGPGLGPATNDGGVGFLRL